MVQISRNEVQMSCTAESVAATCGGIVRDTVSMHRRASLKEAQTDAARMLSLTVRRVQSYWANQVRSVPAHEAFALLAKRRDVIVARQQRLDEELHSLQLRLAALDSE